MCSVPSDVCDKEKPCNETGTESCENVNDDTGYKCLCKAGFGGDSCSGRFRSRLNQADFEIKRNQVHDQADFKLYGKLISHDPRKNFFSEVLSEGTINIIYLVIMVKLNVQMVFYR